MIIGRHARHTTRCAFKTSTTYGFLLAVGAAFACLSALDSPRYSTLTHSLTLSPSHPLTALHTKATYLPIHSPTPHHPHHAPPSGHTHPELLSRALGLVYQVSRTATACGRITLAPTGAPARNVPLRHASLAPRRRLSPSAKVTQFTKHTGKQAGTR
jgi:hypothetical protein